MAKQIVELLKRSIVELCGPDYGNDKLIIESWIENKTVTNTKRWINSESNVSVSAYENNTIVGFALASNHGEILLLYVLPGYTGRGIGKSLYLYLEKLLVRASVTRIFAYSTITAKMFYLTMGFKQFDDVIKVGRYDGEFPLEKKLY